MSAQVRPYTTPAENVVAGWLGVRIPEPKPQRNLTRAGYRKTGRKRGEHRRPPRRVSA